MKLIRLFQLSVRCVLTLALLGMVFGGASCSKKVVRPVAIPVEQLPTALETAFAKTQPDTKELVQQIVGFLKAPDSTRAYQGMQTLSTRSGLTQEQSSVIAGGLLSLNDALQAAQSQGDTKAAKALQYHRETK